MAKIKDIFSYSSRWDSIGLNCAGCKYFQKPPQWPDTDKQSGCKLHNISLAVQIGKNGYMTGEWFCSSFEGCADERAYKEFLLLKPKLKKEVLYGGYGKDGNLKEVDMNKLKIKVSMVENKYGGMTVNERLYFSGLMDKYDTAVERKDAAEVISILKEVELSEKISTLYYII